MLPLTGCLWKQPCDGTCSTVPSQGLSPQGALCCASPASWSQDTQGARHVPADEAGGEAPAQATPHDLASTALSSLCSFQTIHYIKRIELLWNPFQRLHKEMLTFFSDVSNEKRFQNTIWKASWKFFCVPRSTLLKIYLFSKAFIIHSTLGVYTVHFFF